MRALIINTNTIKNYYLLTKPGIIYGNALTALGGFFLAAKGEVDLGLLVAMIVGLSLIIAAGCVFNNYIDQDIDHKMDRTKQRALVTGVIGNSQALLFASLLTVLGAIILAVFTNFLTFAVAMVGLISYVAIYTPLKRRTVYSTLVGAIPGATPPVVGYCAVTNHIDSGALLLFLILVFWQLPHFYAIALYRLNDYRAANLPVLPVVLGIKMTKIQIIGFIIAFTFFSSLLSVFGYTGALYLIIMVGLGLTWLLRALTTMKTRQHSLWGRRVFLFSLIVITSFSLLLSVDSFLI